MAKVLTRRELDKAVCDNPECDYDHVADPRLFLTAQCHPKGTLEAVYDPSRGQLLLTCAECEAAVALIAVKEA